MRIIKNCLAVLVICLIICVSFEVFAKTAPAGIVYTFFEIKSGKTHTSDKWYKNEDFIQQSYYLDKAWTTITNPCKNCKFTVELFKDNASYGKISNLTMKNSGYFSDLSGQNGDWYITVKRNGATALSTWHSGEWYISKQK